MTPCFFPTSPSYFGAAFEVCRSHLRDCNGHLTSDKQCSPCPSALMIFPPLLLHCSLGSRGSNRDIEIVYQGLSTKHTYSQNFNQLGLSTKGSFSDQAVANTALAYSYNHHYLEGNFATNLHFQITFFWILKRKVTPLI